MKRMTINQVAFASALLLHGALLMLGSRVERTLPKPEERIAIRFASIEDRTAPGFSPLEEALPREARPAPVTKEKGRPLQDPALRQEPRPVPTPVPSPAPKAPAEAPAQAPQPKAAPASAVGSAPQSAPHATATAAAPAAQQSRHEAGGRQQHGEATIAAKPSPRMADYLSAVRGMVENNREYPAMARQMGLQGTVTVRVSIRGDGSVGAVTVDVSSGHKALDKAAVSAVKRSAPFKAPTGFGLGEVTVEIPIVYRLT